MPTSDSGGQLEPYEQPSVAEPDGSDEPIDGELLNPIQRDQLIALSERWSAPLPRPQDLQGYENALTGAAERILRMAETDLANSHKLDEKSLDAEITVAKRGQGLAFALSVLALAASFFFFAKGNEVAGIAFISMPVVLLIQAFLDRGGGNGGTANGANGASAGSNGGANGNGSNDASSEPG
jgi:uncharacterized membrane protein